jgi:ribonuclease HII
MLLPYHNIEKIEAGCDEAGRGPLAGPVFAAAVIWPRNLKIDEIRDSKKLNEKQRIKLHSLIEEKALDYAVSMVSETEIDKINILNASILAMHKSLSELTHDFNFILVDGNRFKAYHDIEFETIIRGDDKYLSIAAASILAKFYRDEYMKKLHERYPQYSWNSNKGYPTKKHIEAIQKYGITEFHRKTFCKKFLIDQQIPFE